MEIANRVVAVTGGATGIGFGIAEAFRNAGAQVWIGSRNEESVADAAKSLDCHGSRLDVADRSSVDAFFSNIEDSSGPVEILIQSAGINIVNRSMKAMIPEDWDKLLQVNASGAYYCMHRVLPSMVSRQEGLIVNISSIAGKRALELAGVAYCASKFAMTALGTAVANEHAEHGIRVTNVYPGEVDTPILDRRPVAVSQEHRDRILKPADVAHLVLSIATLPSTAHVPEVVIKPLSQQWM